MKKIYLRGKDSDKFALVDDELFDDLSQKKWYYTARYVAADKGTTKMHRLIIGAKKGEIVDHRNRNPLDNRKENLRIVSKAENCQNRSKQKTSERKYRGISYIKDKGYYQSRCRMNGEDHFLGYFKTEIAAAYAFNKKAKELSEVANINDLPESIEQLEKRLITDRYKVKPAAKQSKYDNIYWQKKAGRMKSGKWNVRIRINGKVYTKGYFSTEEDAYKALQEIKANANNLQGD